MKVMQSLRKKFFRNFAVTFGARDSFSDEAAAGAAAAAAASPAASEKICSLIRFSPSNGGQCLPGCPLHCQNSFTYPFVSFHAS